MPPGDVTSATLYETVQLARDLFGIQSVIFVTGHLVNNFVSTAAFSALKAANERILAFAASWNKGELGVDRVDVLDFGRLSEETIEWNAQLIGMLENVSSSSISTGEYLEQRAGTSRWTPSAAQSCATTPRPDEKCAKNMLTRDGMHPCMETFGGTLTAGLACIVDCQYNAPPHSADSCVERCNSKFMALPRHNATTAL